MFNASVGIDVLLINLCVFSNIGNSVQNSSWLKSHENMIAHKFLLSFPINLKFCTEHGSVTAVLCAKISK